MKYKIAICDDEREQIHYLAGLVGEWAKTKGEMAGLTMRKYEIWQTAYLRLSMDSEF